MDCDILHHRAQQLVERLVNVCDGKNLASATVTVYDTAWISMIKKPHPTSHEDWLFPESFQFLLDSQLASGAWESYYSHNDGLLNTLAALLAMKKHGRTGSHGLDVRMSNAVTYLQGSLQRWDVNVDVQVGSEVIIPALLDMLEGEGICFTFPGRRLLLELNAVKLAKFDPEALYSSTTATTTMIHSLEACIGRVDFDRLEHRKTFGSMMGSPAATATYLICAANWDSEAEAYLRKVVREGGGNGNGSVPSVFPIPIFETTWILSTLLESCFTTETLGKANLDKITSYLEEHLLGQGGIVGFAPSVLPDADDTARAIYTLNLLGKEIRPDRMIDHFVSKKGNFRTYPNERDASFSANCNALLALLYAPDVEQYNVQIISTTTFLCDSWWSGKVNDKWNRSVQYSMMLLAKALTRLLHLWDNGILQTLPDALLRDSIPVIMTQIFNRLLLTQRVSGAWGAEDSVETTAYGILTLKAVCSIPWHTLLLDTAISKIESAQHFLDENQQKWGCPSYLWIEKVTYGSAKLSECYCLAAMKAPQASYTWSDRVNGLMDMPEKPVLRLAHFLTNLHEFKNEPLWKLKASAIEGYTFLPQLKSARMDILPRQKGAKNEYVAYIPLSWVVINNHHGLFLAANLMWDMMILTMCNFRVDEYMETEIAKLSDGDLESIKCVIRDLCDNQVPDKPRSGTRPWYVSREPTNGGLHHHAVINERTNGAEGLRNDNGANGIDKNIAETNENHPAFPLDNFRTVVGHYTSVMLAYPRILNASTNDQMHFRSSLRAFLLSHITQITDNSHFATQPRGTSSGIPILQTPPTSFYTWAHTTGADSVSCPFSFAFFTCLLGAASAPTDSQPQEPTADYFSSVRQKYFAQELCAHLAVMSRLYNDFGSVRRDCLEGNINSTNFPEFHTPLHDDILGSDAEAVSAHERGVKRDLLEVAVYERQCVEEALGRLVGELGDGAGGRGCKGGCDGRKADALKLFVGVAKLYADIYVVRDLSNRVGDGK